MPGVRLNFGKETVGLSFGVPGARYTINSKGRRTVSNLETTVLPYGHGVSMMPRFNLQATPLLSLIVQATLNLLCR